MKPGKKSTPRESADEGELSDQDPLSDREMPILNPIGQRSPPHGRVRSVPPNLSKVTPLFDKFKIPKLKRRTHDMSPVRSQSLTGDRDRSSQRGFDPLGQREPKKQDGARGRGDSRSNRKRPKPQQLFDDNDTDRPDRPKSRVQSDPRVPTHRSRSRRSQQDFVAESSDRRRGARGRTLKRRRSPTPQSEYEEDYLYEDDYDYNDYESYDEDFDDGDDDYEDEYGFEYEEDDQEWERYDRPRGQPSTSKGKSGPGGSKGKRLPPRRPRDDGDRDRNTWKPEVTGMTSSEDDEEDVFKTLAERIVHRRELRDNEDKRKRGKAPIPNRPAHTTNNPPVDTQTTPAAPVVTTPIANTPAAASPRSATPPAVDNADIPPRVPVDPYDKVLKLAKDFWKT